MQKISKNTFTEGKIQTDSGHPDRVIAMEKKMKQKEDTKGDVTVSIIMPVYNMLAYLPQAVGSVLAQTCENWELILVDDGSDDGSQELCDEYAAADSRISVIHQENAGLSVARNSGLNVAKGEYLQFLDSDDWLAPKALSILLQKAEETEAEMIIFAVCYEWKDYSQKEELSLSPGIYNSESILARLAVPALPPYAWNKFCMRYLYEGVMFPPGEKWEDVPTVIYPISRAKKIAIISDALYHYRQRDDSITKKALSDDSINMWRFRQYRKRYEFLQESYPEIAPIARPSLIKTGLLYYACCLQGKEKANERQELYDFLCAEEMGQKLSSKKAALIRRVFRIFPDLTVVLLRLFYRDKR